MPRVYSKSALPLWPAARRRIACALAALSCAAATIDCGSSAPPPPSKKVYCGKAEYDAVTGHDSLHAQGASEGAVGSTRQELRAVGNSNQPAELPRAVLREVVQVRVYNRGNLVTWQTGTVTGAHTVLTAAHLFAGGRLTRREDYDEVRVAYTNGSNQWVEVPSTAEFLNPAWLRDLNNAAVNDMAGGSVVPGDLAIVEVPIDFTDQDNRITPVTVHEDYAPNCDEDDCSTDVVNLVGYGQVFNPAPTAQQVDNIPTRVMPADILNSASNVRDTGRLVFLPFTEGGDSGGPVLVNRNGSLYLVGVHTGRIGVGEDDWTPQGQGPIVPASAASTVPRSVMNEIETIREQWRNNQPVRARIPEAQHYLPNGATNQTYLDPYEHGAAGDATPINGLGYTNSYYVNPMLQYADAYGGGCR